MVAVARQPPLEVEEDQRIFFYGKTWADYEKMLAIRGDAAGPRLFFLDGVIELMSPGANHEDLKTTLARLLEHWAIETDAPLYGYGSWTLKRKVKEAGAEPDECYVVRAEESKTNRQDKPDLVIEVEWSRGSLSKREVYKRLGVGELWTLDRNGEVTIVLLEDGEWRRSKRSRYLPQLDVAWLAGFLQHDSQIECVRALRDELRAKAVKKKSRRRT